MAGVLCAACALLMLLALGGCGRAESAAEPEGALRVYYLSSDETRLLYESYVSESGDAAAQIRELLGQLRTAGADGSGRAALSQGVRMSECRLEDGRMTLVMEDGYRDLSPTTEVLVRAALVRTLSQVEGVEGIQMQIGEEPLYDLGGSPVGLMYADTFVDNEGAEINAYEETTLHLYYADETGGGLTEYVQTVVYNTNISLERLVVEQLIEGPGGIGVYPVLPADTRIISVNVTDGVCYVNLSNEFNKPVETATPEVSIYAIVNSLAELSNVHRVQFMVNGETHLLYRDVIDLEGSFSRNLDLIR